MGICSGNYLCWWLNMELIIKEYCCSDKKKLSQMFYKIQSEEFSWVDKSTLSLDSFEKSTDGEIIYVALIDGKIVGFVSVWKQDNFIHNLFVENKYRSLGVGKSLLEKVITIFNKPLTLKCVKKNLNAVQFYLSNGWKIENEQTGSDGAYYLMSLNS